MAAPPPPPSLHIFPPVQEAERRRDNLDELIRKSMDMRPSRPYQRHPPNSRRNNSGSRTRNPSVTRNSSRARNTSRSRTRTPAPAQQSESTRPSAPKLDTRTVHHQPVQRTSFAPDFNPDVAKTDPLPAPPLNAPLLRSFSRSPMKPSNQAPRRPLNRVSRSTSGASSIGPSPASTAPSSTFSPVTPQSESPLTANEELPPTRQLPKLRTAKVQQLQQVNQVRRVFTPITPDQSESSDDVAEIISPPREEPTRNGHGNKPFTPVSPPRRQGSRVSHRTKHSGESIAMHLDHTQHHAYDQQARAAQNPRVISPAPSDATITVSPSYDPRTDGLMKKPEDYYQSPTQSGQSAQSMFPMYDPTLRLSQQMYYPQRPTPINVPFEKVSKPEYSPRVAVDSDIPSPRYQSITSMDQLSHLWNVANGQITEQLSGAYNLRLFRSFATEGRKGKRMTFGPSETEPFYSLSHAAPNKGDEEELHEALVFRHHTSQDDLLPICHPQIAPPPPPTLSKNNRANQKVDNEPASHISTLTPILATLHALDNASRTPQAHKLALVDPKAESPAAAKMAERAVKEATERESCTLTWMRTDPRSGKYELHHPSLGVFTVQVDGDIKGAFGFNPAKPRVATGISILNPFANVSSSSSPPLFSPSTVAFSRTDDKPAEQKKEAILARLDFNEDVLHLDAGTIQSLGNLYLLDVCVSTLLAVALAECHRPQDPGLLFDAPPPSLALSKAKSRTRLFSSSSSSSSGSSSAKDKDREAAKNRASSTVSLIMMPKRKDKDGKQKERRVVDWTNSNAVMGIEHLTESEDLPRITKGVLSILGAGFKSAMWLLEFGLRISARMVIGLSRMAVKD